MTLANWNIEELTGYKPMTTFYTDLSIADKFGIDAIKDTYKRVKDAWGKDYKYFTEFVMALNWKMWEHNDKGNYEYSKAYQDLWEDAENYVYDNFTEDELSYYYKTTD